MISIYSMEIVSIISVIFIISMIFIISYIFMISMISYSPLILNGIGQTEPYDVNYTLTAIISQVAT